MLITLGASTDILLAALPMVVMIGAGVQLEATAVANPTCTATHEA